MHTLQNKMLNIFIGLMVSQSNTLKNQMVFISCRNCYNGDRSTFQMWIVAHISNISIKMYLVNCFVLQENILYMKYLFSELRRHKFIIEFLAGLFGLK